MFVFKHSRANKQKVCWLLIYFFYSYKNRIPGSLNQQCDLFLYIRLNSPDFSSAKLKHVNCKWILWWKFVKIYIYRDKTLKTIFQFYIYCNQIFLFNNINRFSILVHAKSFFHAVLFRRNTIEPKSKQKVPQRVFRLDTTPFR